MISRPVSFAIGAACAALLSMACTNEVICQGDACNSGGSQNTGGSNTGGNNTGGNVNGPGGNAGNGPGGPGPGGNGGTGPGGNGPGGQGPGGNGGSGGGPGDLTQFCDEMCMCQGCDNMELQQCYQEVQSFTQQALQSGCQFELASLEQCLDQAVCQQGSYNFNCDPQIESVIACMDGPPPPQTVCDVAQQICGNVPEPINCVGEVECISFCIVDAGHCNTNDAALNNCLNDCI